jgi:eukaryotic-like serine/threonine-protein kinase
MALEVGQHVGDYEIIALLGAGGMGRVYKVRSIISQREEAMKVLLPDFASEAELAARFMAEIRTLAGLEHPNIAQLRTAFQFENQLVMVMEYVEGTTLDKQAGQSGASVDQMIEYSMQVLSALSYAHGKGVTHRDIKPANIMVTSHGLVKLMDFGIAKSANDLQLTRPGTTMGSVYYMCPEQVRGETVDARSDIYSFGVTLYEMLTGRKPFQADTSFSVLNAQLNDAPMPPVQVNPALSPELNSIVLRALEKQPADRFQSADEFRNALKALREPQAVQPAPQPMPQSAPQSAPQPPAFTPVPAAAYAAAPATGRSHRGLWIGLGAVVAILALAAMATLGPHFFATHADQKAAVSATDAKSPAATPAAAPDAGAQPNTPAATPASQTTQASTAGPAATSSPTTKTGLPGKTAVTPSGSVKAQPPQTAISSAAASSAPATSPGPSPQQIREVRNQLMNLGARADAARAGVQQIRSQQQAQGLDIRGDILASMSRMDNFLAEANRSLNQNDLVSAKDYLDRADKEVSKLESFLGR